MMILATCALHFSIEFVFLSTISCANSLALRPAMLPSVSSRRRIASPRPRINTKSTSRCMQQLDAEATTSSSSSDNDTQQPSVTSPKFQIGEAQYSDLQAAANLMTDGFYPQLQNNPIMRPIRCIMELDRLQGNFPYEPDDRHFYLVAFDNVNEDGVIKRKVVGFCDVDGRVPKSSSEKKGLSLLPFVKCVQRPQPYFSDLAVDPNYRRQGVASTLMVEAERRALAMGYEELYLGVRSTNELALRMYEKIGYEGIVPSGDMLAFLEIQKDVKMLRRTLSSELDGR